jgi:8-oxo-dGTP pyrophosphatase MutT (NUDIX family)
MENALDPDDDAVMLPPAMAAATLIIVDDSPAGDGALAAVPQLLMVRRSKAMVFAGGAAVFPGGRIDPGDHELARQLLPLAGGDDADALDDYAARIAAIRETVEETGLLIGIDTQGAPLADIAVALRAGLHRQVDFATLLADVDASLDLAALTPFARWCPAMRHTRRFDTRFYLCHAPAASALGLSVDATENSALFWSSAAETLRLADTGDVEVIFPTRRNLERLAQYDDFAALRAAALATPLRTVVPWIEGDGDDLVLRIPDDLDYPITSERLNQAVRG